jgi:hypothetical protein
MEESNESKPATRKGVLTPEELQQQRKKADLLLSRRHVMQQLETSNQEQYSELLRRTLADLDRQIAELPA